MGGKNPFLGWAYVAAAGVFVLLAIAGTARHLLKPRYVLHCWWVDFALILLSTTGVWETCRCFLGIDPRRCASVLVCSRWMCIFTWLVGWVYYMNMFLPLIEHIFIPLDCVLLRHSEVVLGRFHPIVPELYDDLLQ